VPYLGSADAASFPARDVLKLLSLAWLVETELGGGRSDVVRSMGSRLAPPAQPGSVTAARGSRDSARTIETSTFWCRIGRSD
jgi:hypothetical protein